MARNSSRASPGWVYSWCLLALQVTLSPLSTLSKPEKVSKSLDVAGVAVVAIVLQIGSLAANL